MIELSLTSFASSNFTSLHLFTLPSTSDFPISTPTAILMDAQVYRMQLNQFPNSSGAISFSVLGCQYRSRSMGKPIGPFTLLNSARLK